MSSRRQDVWDLVKEGFNEKLPRRTAILVKEEDFSISFAYPSEFGSIGWLLDNREETTYEETPVAALKFGEYVFPDLSGRRLAKNLFYFKTMEYQPSFVKREIVFSNVGVEATELFGQCPNGGFFWRIILEARCHPPYSMNRKFYTVVSLIDSSARVSKSSKTILKIHLGKKSLFIASESSHYGVYASAEEYLGDLEKGTIHICRKTGRHIVLENNIALKPGGRGRLVFGISFQSPEKAARALKLKNPVASIRAKWNKWFNSLPAPGFEAEADRKAYYKCWWIVRLNYYRHPSLGKTVLEALPVYRGYWQWSLPAVEWHSTLNPEIGPGFVKNLLNLFLKHQREDGYVTHAIYLSEKTPGETWSRRSIVQTPHIPWVALRYYHDTKNLESIKAWYPRLVKYYNYLNESRDARLHRLGLWAILTSFDTGLDTFPAFQKVTYGDFGVKEDFCYPAIFAAEKCRFEQAMGMMARILGNGEEHTWFRLAEKTRQTMDRVLWDEDLDWYGVLHQDGSLDTRIGVDGLFPFAYGLVDSDKAQQARKNFLRLIGEYGVFTLAPGQLGFEEEVYWRGPAWAKSCSLAMAAAFNYYPDLLKAVKDSTVRFLLKHPSIWECMSAATGKIARGDVGIMATPVVSSNVGAGEAIGVLLTYYGKNMFSMEPK
ncbi:MAG: hypothetical protein FGF50_07345 [Candidatus Brockarchaeota archaeon]|nr:hypothetical protein [Candidatus Brockarchaeota archaeon]